MCKKCSFIKTGLTVLISVLVVGAAVHATTTVGDNVSVGGTLGVTGATTLSSTLAVTGATTLTGAATLSSTLAVTGASTLTGGAIIGTSTTGVALSGTFTTGITVPNTATTGINFAGGGATQAIKVGALSSTVPGTAVIVNDSNPRVVDVHAEDNDVASADTAITLSTGRFRLVRYANSVAEDYSLHGLVKYTDGVTKSRWGAGVMGAAEATGTTVLSNLTAGVLGRFGTSGGLTLTGAGDRIAAVAAFNNNGTALAGSGKSVGVLVMETDVGTPVDLDYGLEIRDSVATTGIQVGTATTGINFSGAMTTGIDITGGGTVVTGIDIGTTSTTGLSFTGGSTTLINASATAAAASAAGLLIGEASDSAQSGLPLHGATFDTGNAFYCDDDGVALTGYTECLTTRMLTTIAVTGGASADVSTVAFHPDLTLNASYTGKGGLSAIWGNTTIKSGAVIDTSAGIGDVSGGTFGVDIVGTLATNSHAAGVSVGVGGSGTKSGILSGFRIRGATGAVDWDAILSIEDGDGSWTSMTKAAGVDTTATMTNSPKAGNPAYWLKIYIGETEYYFPVWTN